MNRQQRRAIAKRYPKEHRHEISKALKPLTSDVIQQQTEERARGMGLAIVKAKELLGVGGKR